jgi:hypothetical protein
MDDDDCLDTSNLVQLAPRQRITATPLALHALRADVAVQAASAGLAEHAGFADLAAAARRLDAPDGAPTGAVSVDNDGNVGIRTLVVRTSGLVGVGTGAPAAPLHVVAQANDAEPGSGGFIQAGFTEGQNVVFDANEIMARDNGATSTLFLNNDGGNVSISATNAAGKVGIGTDAPGFTLDVRGPMQIANAGDGADLLWLSTERSWVFRQQGTGAETALKLESIGGGGNKHFIIQTILGGGVGIARTPTGNKFEVEGTASKTTAGSWLANSDAAIKTNVRTLTNALVVIARLRPVAFRYTEQYQAKHPSVKDQDYYNYIAQEFREVFPESVQDSGEDGLLQMDEYPAGVYAVAAIQELHAMVQEKACEIDDLAERERSKDQRLRELEERNAKLQARVARLEALLEGSQDAD